MNTDWHLELKAALEALAGAVVTDAWVNEMALYGPEEAGHFTDPSLNFVQANVLELRTKDGKTIHISCVQNDDAWAIWPHVVSTDQQLCAERREGTFRTRPMPDFPRGSVSSVHIEADESSIQEIRMMVEQREVFLRAGEVYENSNGTLSVFDRDESVLVFFDGEAYARLKFNEPIYKPFYR